MADNLAEGYFLKPAVEWEEVAERPLPKVKQKAFTEGERFAGAMTSAAFDAADRRHAVRR